MKSIPSEEELEQTILVNSTDSEFSPKNSSFRFCFNSSISYTKIILVLSSFILFKQGYFSVYENLSIQNF